MKKHISYFVAFFAVLLLFTACTSNINKKENATKNMAKNISKNISKTNTTITKQNKTEVKNQTSNIIINLPLAANVTLPKNVIAQKMIRGTMHTIEVVDVTEDGLGCLIKIDGMIDVVDKGQTKTINGVYIFVSDARIFRSQLEDKDVCQLIIS